MSVVQEAINDRSTQNACVDPVQHDGATLEMQVGERMHLELLTTGERMWGELVGNKQGAFLLVFLPQFNKYRKLLVAETMVAVRALNSQYQLCGFRTTIAKLLTMPHPLMFLDYPSRYEKLSLRKYERVNCLFPAIMLTGGEEYKVMVTNISTGGAGIVLNLHEYDADIIAENVEVFLVFRLADGKDTVVRGEVRNLRENDGKLQLGVKFNVLIDDSKNTIEAYVNEVKHYNTNG